MDTHDRKVIDVLGDQKRFIVPFYQRHYKWDETLWQSFWDDVRSKAEEALSAAPKFDHYMGALILAPESYSVAVTPRLLVVDGQQRLTTFQLFLVAMREVGDALDCPEIGESARNYLFNNPMSGDVGDDVIFKLAPNRADRRIFYDLVRGGLQVVRSENQDWFFKTGRVIKKYAPNSVRAVSFFTEYIRQFATAGYVEEAESDEENGGPDVLADDDASLEKERLHALMQALLRHLKLVVITLGEDDDAQVIFETLNSKNEPLTAMELVRNFIFQRAAAHSDAAEKLFEDRWQPLEDRFWNETAPRARPRRPRIDHYLGYTLTAQTGDETSLRELYAEYRSFARPKGQSRFESVDQELDALLQYVPVYQALEGNGDDDDLIWLGEKLAPWEVTTAYPVVFAVAVSDVDQTDKRQMYELINSYLVRRAICGLTPKNLNKNFQRIVSILLRDGVSIETFANTFSNQNGDSVRFPSDSEFRNAIQHRPLYQQIYRKERLREILWSLELEMRDKFSVDTAKPNTVSIEHILPQNWHEHWALPDGQTVTRDDAWINLAALDEPTREAVTRRDLLLHTLGNLSLVTVPANTVQSNSPFDEKRKWLEKSLLAMNHHIVGHTEWTEETIEERGAMLGDLAINIWPSLPN